MKRYFKVILTIIFLINIFTLILVTNTVNANGKTLEDGMYEIEVGVDSEKVLDVVNASRISGENVQIYTRNNGNCQKVNVKYIGDGYYTITFVHSKMRLDVANGNTADHTNVWQCREIDADAQKWIIKDAGDGYYNIISKLKDKYLTVANGETANCTNIEINEADGSRAQRFKFNRIEKIIGTQTIENGIYEIETGVDRNKVLEVIDSVTYSGGNVQINTRNNGMNQKVDIVYQGNGYYTIEFIHSEKLLDVYYGKIENHINVWQCNPNDADAQKWVIKDAGNGYYNIISKVSNTYLTVAGGNIANGTNLEINTNKNDDSQKFKLNKIESTKGNKTLDDGTYEIEVGVDSNKALDVINASSVSGANVQIYTKNNGNCQKVDIKYIGDGYYTLTFKHSNMRLDVSNGKTSNHTNVWQCREIDADAQKWIIQDTGDGYYNIISKLKDKYLTVANGETANCTNIEINVYDGSISQKFKFNKIEKIIGTQTIEDGTYEIETGVDSSKAVDVINSVTYSGGNVQICTKNKALSQRVNIKYEGNGYYTLEFSHSKKLLDVSNGNIEHHTNVWQCYPNGADAQKWVIQDVGNGYYNIISKLSNTYLTVADGNTLNGTNIEINSNQNNNSQKFKLNKVEKTKGTKTIEDGIYEIEVGVDGNKAIDVINASKISGGNVQIYTKNNAYCQNVNVQYEGDGYYTIEFVHSKKLLDVSNGDIADHTNVWQCNPNGADAQKWIIKDTGNGYYNIISKLSDTYLTVKNGETNNCTNIEINSNQNDNSQKFKFNKIDKIEAKETIKTGLYEIEPAVASDKALDVNDATQISGGNVQIYRKNNGQCQKVIVDYIGNGNYLLTFLHSGKMLDVANGLTYNHTNVWQCTENGADAQKWIIQDAGNGFYNIISKIGNVYLTVANAETDNCTNIEVNCKVQDDSQKFKFNKLEEFYGRQTIEDGLYEIETKLDSNKVVEVIDASEVSGANVQIFTRNSNANCQKVQVKHLGNGLYNIEFLHSGMMLDVANAGIVDHTNVWQCNPNGADAQVWAIRYTHDGYYNIVSKSSGKNITVANGGTANCTNIEINTPSLDNNQKFKFNKTKIAGETGIYGYSGLAHQGNSSGSALKYYKYGFGKNVLFTTFAVHGFEDNWYRDGQALTEIANRFYNRLVNDNDLYIAKNWTVYIFPSINPDGEYYGTSNAGPGRRTLFSMAPGNAGIDINRNWKSVGSTYKRFTDSRNYNGTAELQAYEAAALESFLKNHKSNDGKTVLIDLHGWENSLIGDQSVLDYYYFNFSNATQKYGRYGDQYLISWARTDLRAEVGLIELPSWIYSMQDVANNDIYNKYINSSINMLKTMPITNAKKSIIRLRNNNEANITEQEQFNIAFAGLIKNDIPSDEEVKQYQMQQPTKSGVWIEEKSKEKILNMINGITNLKYETDKNNYLKIKQEQEENEKNEYDIFIQKLINSDELFILSKTGKLYFKDIVSKELTVDLYEDLDSYQTYNYIKYENKTIIDMTTNEKNHLDNKEIMNSLIELLK